MRRCPCGSGKRYKDCHGALAPPLPAGAVGPPLLAKARQRSRPRVMTGQAEAAWRQALERRSGRCRSLVPSGQPRARARSSRPRRRPLPAGARCALPVMPACSTTSVSPTKRKATPAEAEACYREVLAATPNHPDALANLANVLFGREDFAAAADSYDRAVRHPPRRAGMDLGQARHRTGSHPRHGRRRSELPGSGAARARTTFRST